MPSNLTTSFLAGLTDDQLAAYQSVFTAEIDRRDADREYQRQMQELISQLPSFND